MGPGSNKRTVGHPRELGPAEVPLSLRLNGKRFDQAMRVAGFNQKTLARKIGVADSQVSRWISGETVPRADVFLAACVCMRVSPFVLCDVPANAPPHAAAVQLLRMMGLRPEANVVDAMAQLSDADREALAERALGWIEGRKR